MRKEIRKEIQLCALLASSRHHMAAILAFSQYVRIYDLQRTTELRQRYNAVMTMTYDLRLRYNSL